MQNLQILNSRETKHILEKLDEQYGYDIKKSELDFIFMINKDNRIYILSKDVGNVQLEDFKIDSLGMYFGEEYKESIRLSIEGAQLIAKNAKKNIVSLDRDQMLDWVKGCDIDFDDCGKNFVIVKYKDLVTGHDDILGCGKYKEGKLINYVSKSRKLVVVNE